LSLQFQKWQALGNDYIIVEQEKLPFELTPARVRLLCAPHLGCHSDGVLLLSRSTGGSAAARLRIFNPDGSEAELSGNGAREAILYAYREGWANGDAFSIETAAGEIRPTIIDDRNCAIEIGAARLQSADFPSGGADGKGSLTAAGRQFDFQHVNVGNPQCVIEVGDEIEQLDLESLGPEIERHQLFPNRTNVAFISVEGDQVVRARIFERGVGETLSSGTGACASAVTAVLGGAQSPVTIRLDGGELEVAIGSGLEVTLTGWAEPVFKGELSEELMAALAKAQ
jgi:diaminopimelate epimerase